MPTALLYDFPDFRITSALRTFVTSLHDHFGPRLLSVLLYGSILFDDLSPGYGDLDFLAILDGDLTDDDRQKLIALRRPLRSPAAGPIAPMIEGAFLPRHMLDATRPGQAFWWGTSGEKPWASNQLGWFVLHVIRERGLVLYGQDLRHDIPPVRHEDLVETVWWVVHDCREYGANDRIHAIDFLLTAARMLLWVHEGRLSSKSEAAAWAATHARGDWKHQLPRARQLRREPQSADLPDTKAWLRSLTDPTRQAAEELADVLTSRNWCHNPPAIRPATRAHTSLLTWLIRQSFHDVAHRHGLTPQNCPTHPSNCSPDWIERAMDKGTQFYLFYHDGPCACVALERANESVCYLERLAVLPHYRHRGFGRLLTEHVLHEARRLGAKWVELALIADETDLLHWYERRGFTCTDRKTFPQLPFAVQFMSQPLPR